MKLFKIENRGLRFLAGMAVMLAIIAIILVVFWAVGYGAISLDEKFLNWDLRGASLGSTLGMIALGFFLGFAVWVAGNLSFLFIKGSRVLGNQLFNNFVQTLK